MIVVDELFKSLNPRYQGNLQTSMTRSDFVFDSFQLFYYKCDILDLRCGGSNIDSPNWIKSRKATINPKNKDDKCFQYTVTVVLNYEEIELHRKRVSNIKPLISEYI